MTRDPRKPLEKDIQAGIMRYLSTQRKLIYWRQNSGSFTAYAIRVMAGVLKRFKLSPVSRNGIMGSLKKAVGHYECTSEKGLPDITVVYRGVYVGLEVKKHDGRQNKDQIAMEKRMAKVGAHYFVVRSISDVIEALNTVDKMFVKSPDDEKTVQ